MLFMILYDEIKMFIFGITDDVITYYVKLYYIHKHTLDKISHLITYIFNKFIYFFSVDMKNYVIINVHSYY